MQFLTLDLELQPAEKFKENFNVHTFLSTPLSNRYAKTRQEFCLKQSWIVAENKKDCKSLVYVVYKFIPYILININEIVDD